MSVALDMKVKQNVLEEKETENILELTYCIW